jgi:CO dehydrogenase/acetyl-CoA synthase alpha subunit
MPAIRLADSQAINWSDKMKLKKTAKPKPKKMTHSKTVNVQIMGKKYTVPEQLTIMKAMEHAGYRLLRGCGCRGGFCGACGTIYRKEGEYKLYVGLACQTVVEDGMIFSQIPYFPVKKAIYDIQALKANPEEIFKQYPEIFRCLSCNTCTKICPQDLSVMDYVQALIKGDISKAAELSFDCIMCGLCASRCPAEISQPQVAILARRLFSKYIVPPAAHLSERLKEIESGKFSEAVKDIMSRDEIALKKMYSERQIEPGD